MTSRRRLRPPSGHDLAQLDGHRVALWREGNAPDQQLADLSAEEVARHLCALYLLADEVVASASFYFESEITRAVTRKLRLLFESGSIVYFVDDAKESFLEHAAEKKEKSPIEMVHYQDTAAIGQRAMELASLGHLLRRPAISISDRIVSLWCADAASTSPDTIGGCLVQQFAAQNERLEWIDRLVALTHDRAGDFVWEYVEPLLRAHSAPRTLVRVARRRLAGFYTTATAQVLGIEAATSSSIVRDRKLDSGLFLECMRVLGVSTHFAHLSVADLISLKQSREWLGFKAFYWTLLDSGATDSAALWESLPLYSGAEDQLRKHGQTPQAIQDLFGQLRGTVAKKVALDDKPLKVLLSLYDLFDEGAIFAFRNRLSRTTSGLASRASRGVTTERRTVVEVDLVGYSSILRMLEQGLGQAAAFALDEQIRGFIRAGLVSANTKASAILDTGDGAIIAFTTAPAAHAFAEQLHSVCRTHNAARSEASAKRMFRSGAATGDVAIAIGDDGRPRMAGDTIVRAVRLETAARPGEFVVDEETLRALPEDIRTAYSAAARVPGKRDEIFVVHRRVLDEEAAATRPQSSSLGSIAAALPVGPSDVTTRDRRRQIVDLAKKIPREHVDLLMILLDMPLEMRPAALNGTVERMARIIDWASLADRLDDLYDELRAYG